MAPGSCRRQHAFNKSREPKLVDDFKDGMLYALPFECLGESGDCGVSAGKRRTSGRAR